MNALLQKRRVQSFLIFGVTGTLVGIMMRAVAGFVPNIPPVEISFFIAWWIGSAIGSLLIPFGRAR